MRRCCTAGCPWTQLWNRSPLVILLLAQHALGWAQAKTPSPLPVLTTAQQVRVLSPDEANRAYPVRLRAVVTYCDFRNQDFFVQDATAGIFVDDPALKTAFATGDELEIEGVTEDPDFAPQIGKPRYRILGQAPLPRPQPASFDALISTREDSQFVQFEGVVQSASSDSGRLILDVLGDGGHLNVNVLNPQGLAPAQLVDARVRLQGVCGAIFNQQRQLTAVQLQVPGRQQIIIFEPPAPDPFSLPVRALRDLMVFTPQGTSEHRIRVQGTVTLRRPRRLFIQEGSQGLSMPWPQAEAVAPGDRVDAVGFADVGEYSPVLQHAVVRRTGSASLPVAAFVTARQALSGTFDAVRVSLDATIHDQRQSETDKEIIAQDGDVLFEVRLDQQSAPANWPNLPPGTRVRLTGVCSVVVDRDRQPTGFAILLDSPAGLVVLARPSWWTLRRAVAGLTLLAVVALAVVVWVVVLRQKVQEQTELIRRRLESEAALERRLEYVMRCTDDLVWDWDVRAGRVWRSDGLGTVLEYRSEDMDPITGWWPERIHPGDRDRVIRGFDAVLKGSAQQWSDEYRFRRDTGDYAYSFDRCYVIRDESGHPVRVIGAMMDVSAARKTQEDLRESEEKYRSLVTNMPDAIWTADAEGRLAYVSSRFERLSGYSLEEIKDRGVAIFFENVHPDERSAVVAAFHSIFTEGQGEVECRVRRKDGEWVWVHNRAVAVYQKNGMTYADGLVTDITLRKRAEEALRQTEESFRLLFLDNPLPMWVYDLGSLRFLEVNSAAVADYGYSRTEFLNMSIADVRPPEDIARLRESLNPQRPALQDSGPWRHVLKSGRVIDVQVTSHLTRWNGVSAVFVVAQDITERKRAEETKARLASIVESSEDAIIGKTLEGTIVSWNHGAELLYGYPAEEVVGKSISILAPPDRPDEVRRILSSVAQGVHVSYFDTVRLRKDGTPVDVSISISPLKNAAGEVVGASAIERDTTERRRAEEALRNRTLELERSNAELEQFAYVASHDLQEPLRMVTNFSQLLAERYKGRLDGDADEFIGFAVEGATRMRALIDGLLSFARVKSRAEEPELTDTGEVLGRCLTALRVAIKNARAEVTHGPLPTVLADEMQLDHLFQNLLSNALKFHNSSPPRVHVSAHRDGDEWVFAVKDNGIGIDPRYHERVFVIFQRLHSRQAYPGTGIGLSICKRIVEHHHGRIWVESSEGRGATFYFTIPALPDRGVDHSATVPRLALQSTCCQSL